MRFSPQVKTFSNQLADVRSGIIQIAKQNGVLPAGQNTGRQHSLNQPFLAEVALLHDTFGARREVWIDLRNKRPRVAEIHASCSVRAGGHAKPATDAAVIIHHDDAVGPPERGLRGADPDAGRIFAVIAHHGNLELLQRLSGIGMVFGGEDSGKRFVPDPFDFIFGVPEVRDIVRCMAGGDAFGAISGTFGGVNHHGPAFGHKRFNGREVLTGNQHGLSGPERAQKRRCDQC